MTEPQDKTKVDLLVAKIKNHRILAWIIVAYIGLIALGTATGALDKIRHFFWPTEVQPGQVAVTPAVRPATSSPASRPTVIATDYFPLRKGNYWTYEGQVIATTDKNQLKNIDATITTTVMDEISSHNSAMTIFVMQGDMGALFWASSKKEVSEAKKARYGLLVIENKVYRVEEDGLKACSEHVRHAEWFSKEELAKLELEFDLPLYCQQVISDVVPADPNGMYAWQVIPDMPVGKAERFLLSYLTNPDVTHLSFEPYLGIVGCDYRHNGTTCEAHVKLVDYRVHTKPPLTPPTPAPTPSPSEPVPSP